MRPPNPPPAFDELLTDPALRRVSGDGGERTACAGLTDDSRDAVAGGVFVARGSWSPRAKGFVEDAIARGVSAVVVPAAAWESDPALREGLAGVAVAVADDVDQALAGRLADAYFGHPARGLRLVGVTGTNGKTTVAMLTQHLLRASGLKPGLLGTVWTDVGEEAGPRPAELTTPGAIELRRHLAAMVSNGCDTAVMEVSSHALDQGRVAGLAFDAAVFTNLTQDHLDYHGTMDAYAAAKARLFTMLKPQGWAVVNGDDPYAEVMVAGVSSGRVMRTRMGRGVTHDRADGPEQSASATPESLESDRSTARFDGPWGSASATLPLVGEHNLSNALQAAAATHTLMRTSARELRERLAACPPVPGRLEPVRRKDGRGPSVLVDYAHTPDALERVASTLKPLTEKRGGRLIVVYGCGGDRDRTKRPKMTDAALAFADHAVLTSDNPRSEDPQRILDDAAAGLAAVRRDRLTIQVDRAAAIHAAITGAAGQDTVLIAGKGHEDYQVLADPPGAFGGATKKVHFDDREHAAAALRRWQPPAVAC
ncbi:MAG: UDP-N-acetylmuramoyl-L-alanyl-D-glutamate--2,6-diaminopimelate ligase [Planctomycetota bacterium]